MTTYCPYCGRKMTYLHGKSDFDYVEAEKVTYWDIEEKWACLKCVGPEE